MPDEPALAKVLGALLDARDKGVDADEDALLREHTAQRSELQRRLAALSLLDHVRPPLQDAELPIVSPDRYEAVQWAGQGGMGLVYWATDKRLHRRVALKVIRPGNEDAPASPFDVRPPPPDTPERRRFELLKARLMQEVWITSALDHPNVVPIYDVGQTPHGVPFYTMRYFVGVRTLATAVEELDGASFADRLALLEPFLKLCDTIQYAHTRGVIHRDIKPENVVLGEFGEVIVVDWGLAAMLHAPDAFGPAWKRQVHAHRETHNLRTEPGRLGTPEYMSPEAARGDAVKVGVHSDVYSLSVVLFEILTGRLPSGAAQDHLFAPELPKALRDVCRRAIASAPEERYPDVRALADAVRAEIRNRAAQGLKQRDRSGRRRDLVVVGLLALVVVVAMGWLMCELFRSGGFGNS